MANGNATVTATSAALSGTGAVVVQQVAATVIVTPADPTVSIGADQQMTAVVSDANGNAMAGAEVGWSSSDATIASVSATGLVTGVAEGTATITATSGNVTGSTTTTVILVPLPFEPTTDQDIGGTMTVAQVTIPAGVTITVTSDLVLNATGPVTIDGTLTGDCVRIDVNAATSLTISGTIENLCAGGATTLPGLSLTTDGPLTTENATIASAGEMLVSNTEHGAAPSGAVLKTYPHVDPCFFLHTEFYVFGSAANGANGSPTGGNGEDGAGVTIRCSGDAEFTNSTVDGQSGGDGGNGWSDADGVEAVGGNGGDGGKVRVEVTGNLVLRDHDPVDIQTNSLKFFVAAGGAGGHAYARGRNAMARGGDGGHSGTPRLVVGGTVTTFGNGLEFNYAINGRGGPGGDALVEDPFHGAHATSSAPAEVGGNATAVGGRGGNVGGTTSVSLIGDIVQASSIPNPENINLNMARLGSNIRSKGGQGGLAHVKVGNGGDGSAEFKPGAHGGAGIATGGDGGDS